MTKTSKPTGRRISFGAALSIAGVLTAVLGLGYLFLTPKTFQASAKIKVWKHGWVQGDHPDSAFDPSQLLSIECDLIRSEAVLNPVIHNLALNQVWAQRYNQGKPLNVDQTRSRLLTVTDVQPVPDSGVVQIKVASADQNEPAKIANEIGRIYVNYRQTRRQESSSDKIGQLKQEWEAKNLKVKDAQDALDKLTQDINHEQATSSVKIYDPASYQNMLADRVQFEMDCVKQKSALDSLKTMDSEQRAQTLSVLDTNANSVLTSCLRQLDNASVELTAAQNSHGSNSPEVQSCRLAIAGLRKRVGEATDGAMAGREQTLASLKAQLDDLNHTLSTATTNMNVFNAQDLSYKNAVQDLDKLKQERDSLQDQMSREETIVAQTRMTLIPMLVSAEFVDEAEPPAVPASPNSRLALSLIFGGAFAAMAGLLLLLPRSKTNATPNAISAARR